VFGVSKIAVTSLHRTSELAISERTIFLSSVLSHHQSEIGTPQISRFNSSILRITYAPPLRGGGPSSDFSGEKTR
jgi:hypothetical protein